MSNKLMKPLNKVFGAMGLVDEEDDEIIERQEIVEEDSEFEEPELLNTRKNKIVSIKTNSQAKVVLKKPTEMQDVMEIIDCIKSRRIVVMNIVEVEAKLSQRMLDSISGACYALNGVIQEVGKSIYLIAPDNVEISNELRQQINNGGFLNF